MSDENKTESKKTESTPVVGNVSTGIDTRRSGEGHVEKVLQVVGTPQGAIEVAPVKPSGGEPIVTPSGAAKEAATAKLVAFSESRPSVTKDSNNSDARKGD